MDGPVCVNIFVVDNKVGLAPDIASETIHRLLAKVGGVVDEPVRAKDAHIKMEGFAGEGIEIIVERGTIGPFEVVQHILELVVDDVEVAAVGPIVPEVGRLQMARARVDEEQRMELQRPWRWRWGRS